MFFDEKFCKHFSYAVKLASSICKPNQTPELWVLTAQFPASEHCFSCYTYIQVLLISFPPSDISLHGALLSPEITIVLFPFFQNSKIQDVLTLLYMALITKNLMEAANQTCTLGWSPVRENVILQVSGCGLLLLQTHKNKRVTYWALNVKSVHLSYEFQTKQHKLGITMSQAWKKASGCCGVWWS